MIKMNLQFFGGRGAGSSMGSGGGSNKPEVFSKEGTMGVRQVLGMSATEAADDYWDRLRIPAGEKYAQVEAAANRTEGVLGAQTHMADVVRMEGGKNNPDMLEDNGRSWKTFRNDTGEDLSAPGAYDRYLDDSLKAYQQSRDQVRTSDGNAILFNRLSAQAKTELTQAISSSAKKWLQDHPKPEHPRKDGYKWDGTKYIKS